MLRSAVSLAAVALMSLAACTEDTGEISPVPTAEQSVESPSPASPSPAAPSEEASAAAEEISAIPDLSRIDCETVKEPRPCWLPVNPFAYLIEGVALTDQWPKEAYGAYGGDGLQVVCQTEGEGIQDNRGAVSLSTVWYEVIIPKGNLTIVDDIGFGLTPDDLEQTPDGKGYYGYVSAVWLPVEVAVPSC